MRLVSRAPLVCLLTTLVICCLPHSLRPALLQAPQSQPQTISLERYTRCVAQNLDIQETVALALLIEERDPLHPLVLRQDSDEDTPARSLQILPQIIPVTQKTPERHQNVSHDMPNLPVLVYSQLHYLKTLQSRYGNLQEALAAYHMGPAQFERHAYRPRSETRRYVNHILAKAAQLQSAQAAPHLVLYYPLYAHDFTHISHLNDIQDCALGKYGQATTSTQLTASSSPPDFSYPVRFVRISSPFSRARLHPILKQYRSHLGIDFAAPKGSPVWAAADGSVQLAGWQGGFGKLVRISHTGSSLDTYRTEYAHLDRIAKGIQKGSQVKHGQVIGYVGSSGLSTGPHLHFAVLKNGAYINPQASPLLSASHPGSLRSESLSWFQ